MWNGPSAREWITEGDHLRYLQKRNAWLEPITHVERPVGAGMDHRRKSSVISAKTQRVAGADHPCGTTHRRGSGSQISSTN